MILVASRLWAVSLLLMFGIFVAFGWTLLAISVLIIISAAAHEAIHSNLFSSRSANKAYAILAYSLVGHNAVLISSSHSLHHIHGRSPDLRYVVENRSPPGSIIGAIEYYGLLFGTGYYWNILGGFVTVCMRNRLNYFYGSESSPKLLLVASQILVVVCQTILIVALGYEYLAMLIAFGVFWGVSQNLPHYALPMTNDANLRHAARSYRVPKVLHFIFFGTMFSHLSHHVFQGIPGVLLADSELDHKVGQAIGITMKRKPAFKYFVDMAKQFTSPWPKVKNDWHAGRSA
jgi:fatty acid desaturase